MELKDSKILGSRDHAGIMGLDKWANPHSIFRRIVLGEQREPGELLQRGLFMEQGHSEMVQHNLSQSGYTVKLKKAKTLFYEVEGVPMRMTGDYFAVPSNIHRKALFGVELKQAHGQQRADWGEVMSDDVPEMYKVQAIMQCYKYSWPFCIIDADFTTFALSTPFLVYADNERARHIEQQSVKFWKEHIETGVPPEADNTSECRKTLLERERLLESRRPMTPEEMAHAARLIEIERLKKALDNEKDGIQNKLVDSAGPHEQLTHPVTVGDGGNGKVIQKNFALFKADKNGKMSARFYPKSFAGGL